MNAPATTSVWCELALIDDRVQPGVTLGIDHGRIGSIDVATEPDDSPTDTVRLAGLTVPGLANAHSHAFHRALRSRTQAERGTFWTWRDLMYRAADRLEPDTYRRLARAVYAEMAMAGVTCVGEFHYLHHRPDGTPYDDPNAMGRALLDAAADAGIRITLLDTAYLHGGLDADGHRPAAGVQRRFDDGDVDAWRRRVDRLADELTADEPSGGDSRRIGAAVHSVRAVDPDAMRQIGEWAAARSAPLHAHVSEQVAENEACRARHGRTPMAVLADAGLLSERFAAVHATHLTDDDVALLASSGSSVVMCPTTERDLGDGIGPTREFADAGVAMAVGSDSHAVIDLFEEARALELDERLRSRERGIHAAPDLLVMATAEGHRTLGWSDAGSIAVGRRADLVTVRLDSVRTAGVTADAAVEAVVFAASAVDVTDVFVDGRHVVAGARHATIDVETELAATIEELMSDG
ncbi:MAG: formimidoylglutamate deiminase [Ilumatobacter sp.]|nr:formimidoylglutamate deiminase [Ilumatobacter sp.]